MTQVLVVTGASRGIGAAVALAGARNGYAVCVNYHRSGAAAEALVRSGVSSSPATIFARSGFVRR